MPQVKRQELAAEAHRRNLEQLAALGGEVRAARLRRHWTQQQVADRAGISRSSESRIERGAGGGQSLDTWQRVALAVNRPLIVRLQRDAIEETTDAGHLAMQELLLRLGRQAGFAGSFELPTRAAEPWRSVDVGLRHDALRTLALLECWNSIGDIGASARSTARKVAEAEQLAVAIGGDRPYRVASCWVVRHTRRNRELVRRYPAVFEARFPGSSERWVRFLLAGKADSRPPGARERALEAQGGAAPLNPPLEPGLVWCSLDATRLFAWRRR